MNIAKFLKTPFLKKHLWWPLLTFILEKYLNTEDISCDILISYCCFSYIILLTGRSSRPEVLCRKGVLRNFAKFTGKHLCQNLFFNKIAGLRHANLLKKRLWHRCFPENFVKILRKPFYIWWLLLDWVTIQAGNSYSDFS